MKFKKLVWHPTLVAAFGLLVLYGCNSGGPPTPTLQTSGSGIDSKKQLTNVQNSNMPNFFKQKREKVLQNRIQTGTP